MTTNLPPAPWGLRPVEAGYEITNPANEPIKLQAPHAVAVMVTALPELLHAAKAVAYSNGFDAALPEKIEALRAAIAKAGGAA